ncbi:MAG: pentapeptide repeat-containing protein [Leptolyngbya sp. SIO3F4]|nr:pentapeptide repeat-containing protein [Leptolyngbya sp. SIO3F4]
MTDPLPDCSSKSSSDRKQEELNLLLHGSSEDWNHYRENATDDFIDCTEIEFTGVDLSKFNLSRINFSKANLSEANLSEANLSETNLSNANLRFSNLSKANLTRADLNEADLNGANLRGATLSKADLSRANLTNIEGLKETSTSRALFSNFSQANLQAANLIRARLRGVNLSGVDLRGADLREADLRDANLSKANLSEANLKRVQGLESFSSSLKLNNAYYSPGTIWPSNISLAEYKSLYLISPSSDLSKADLSKADLSKVDLSKANLSEANLSEANLSEANLSEANLSKANLSEANLSKANLSKANLSDADINAANLSDADLSEANLRAAQLLNTILAKATLTGVCILDWHINLQTSIVDLSCDYIFLSYDQMQETFTDRRPSDENSTFQPDDFRRLVQQAQSTVDLIFREGIHWRAFMDAFAQIRSEEGNDEITVRGIEADDDGSLVVRINTPISANQELKGAIESGIKRLYEQRLQLQEEEHRKSLQAKDQEIEMYKKTGGDMMEITRILASRPVILDVDTRANSSMSDNYINQGTVGFMGKAQDQAQVQVNMSDEQKQNLTEIAHEIQQLLDKFSKNHSTHTATEQMQVAMKTIEHIEQHPTLKDRAINALIVGGKAALEQSLSHPAASFVINAIEGWKIETPRSTIE